MMIHDDIYEWEGWGGRLRLASGKCRLRIFDLGQPAGEKSVAHLKPHIVMVSDVEDSRISVRSCAGHVATCVARDFNIKPNRMMYVEYYPETQYGPQGDQRIPETYEAVEFTWIGDRAIKPQWRPLPAPLREQLSGLMAGR